VFRKFKTSASYRFMLKWNPPSVCLAIRYYQDLPLGERDMFLASHCGANTVCCSLLLKQAGRLFGTPGAVPSCNFIRKLFTSEIARGHCIEEKTWKEAAYEVSIRECAILNNHSPKMALSSSYNLSDRDSEAHAVISLKVYLVIMKGAPKSFPDRPRLTAVEFHERYLSVNFYGDSKRRPKGVKPLAVPAAAAAEDSSDSGV